MIQVVAVNHLKADVQVAAEGHHRGVELSPMVKEALHDTDRSAMLLELLLPEGASGQNVVPADDQFLKPEEWTGIAYSKNQRDALAWAFNAFWSATDSRRRGSKQRAAVT